MYPEVRRLAVGVPALAAHCAACNACEREHEIEVRLVACGAARPVWEAGWVRKGEGGWIANPSSVIKPKSSQSYRTA